MRHVRSASEMSSVESAPVGVLGFTAKDLTPRAVAVTPYVIDGRPTVTTMLALLTKAKMLRARPTAALYAGGVHVAGAVEVELHRKPDWFDANIRDRELEKYPPAKSILSIPFHRRLLWWYVGRVAFTFDAAAATEVDGDDRVTLTSVVDGRLLITPLDPDIESSLSTIGAGDHVELGPDVPDGPACVLVHHETKGMAELLSVTWRGQVTDGDLTVRSRHGSLEPQNPGTIAQLKSLRALGRSAKANLPTIDAWNTEPSDKGPRQ